MGGGSSTISIEEKITKNAPVEFPDLQLDGTIHSRDEYHGGRPGYHRRGSTTPNNSSPKHKSPKQPSALELQAAAHWHRLIEHALSDQPLQLKKPRCPECVRGNHNGPFCSICGIDITMKQPFTPRDDEENEKESRSPLVPVVRWNTTAQEYERMLITNSNNNDDQKIDNSNLKQYDEKDNDSNDNNNNLRYTELGDPDHDRIHTERITDMLKTTASTLRRRSSVEVSNITKMGAEAARNEMRQKALAEEKDKLNQQILEKEQRKKDRSNKMNNLFSSNEIGDDSDTSPIRALRGKEMNEENEIDVDDDGNEIDYEGPDNDLPEVQIELKSRTSNSITLSWDVNALAQEALEEIRKFHENKSPTYELMFRIHTEKKIGDNPWILGHPRTRKFGGIVEHLVANTPYVFRCRRIGWGGWGPSVVIRTGPGPPSAPKGLCAKEVTSSSILITWQLPEKDNGLPIIEYSVRMKAWGGEFQDIYRGKDRLFLATGLTSNLVHIFEVKAGNKMGLGTADDKLAIRTLPHGAANMTPWVEAIDDKTGKLFYCHTKTNETAWTIPKGVILDEAGSLKNKHYYLKNRISKRSVNACNILDTHSHVIQLEIKRGNILEESLQQIYAKSQEEIDAGPIRVKYQNEEGLDAGGLAKDWFSEVSRNLIEGSTGLFIQNEHGFATIDSRAAIIHKPSESRWLFKALGIFFAKALIDGQTLGMTINPTILMLMCGKTPVLEDLKDIDPSFYRGLKWVEENNVEGADLSFSASYELFGNNETIKFIENGDTVAVTEDNKEEYLDLIQQWLFRGRYEPGLTHLLDGFHRHIPVKELEHFSRDELQLMIGGRASIDVLDIARDVEFAGGFEESSPQVEWLWEVLGEFDQENLSRFLSFVTGCPSLPVDGLKPSLLLTHTEGTDNILPRAHTCFNQLVMPKYSTYDILKERLVYALNNSNEEFHMA